MSHRVVRLAHLADTHLGYRNISGKVTNTGANQRQQDCRDAFAHAIGDILRTHRRHPIDLFIHAGDIFDHPRPSPTDVVIVLRAIRDIAAAGIVQVWIAGNHDVSRITAQDSTLGLLRAAFNPDDVHIWDEPAPHIFRFKSADGRTMIQVDGFPHGATRAMQPTTVDEAPAAGDIRLAVAHGDMDANGMLSQGDHNAPLEGDYSYIALGHIHTGDKIMTARGPALQAGSTERFGWRDQSVQTHWLEVELNDLTLQGWTLGCDEHPVASRPMIDLGTLEWEPEQDIAAIAGDIEGLIVDNSLDRTDPEKRAAMWRVHLNGIPGSQQAATRQLLRRYFNHALWDLQIDMTAPGDSWRSPLKTMAATGGFNIARLFEEYLDGRTEELGAEFLERFKRAGLEALEQASLAAREAVEG